MKIKSRHHLKGSDARKVIASIEPFLDDPSSLRKASLEMAISDEGVDLIFVDGKPLMMIVEGEPSSLCWGPLNSCLARGGL